MKYPALKLSMLQRQLISLAFAALLFTVPTFAAEQWTEPVTRMKFVSVPGGSFRIGDQFDEGSDDEQQARSILWLNPLMGNPGYEPTTRGMQAVLPYIDLLVSAHNVASLRALVRQLSHIQHGRQLWVA